MKSLALLQELYITPLKEKKKLSDEVFAVIFSNIQSIHGLHNMLLDDMRKRLGSNWFPNQKVADLFVVGGAVQAVHSLREQLRCSDEAVGGIHVQEQWLCKGGGQGRAGQPQPEPPAWRLPHHARPTPPALRNASQGVCF